MKRVRLEVLCTEDYKKQVKQAADKRGVNISSYIKNALFEQMKKDAK